MRKVLKVLVTNRMIILSVLGVSLYLAISKYNISLWYIVLAGAIMGVVFGKVFCRWVCPMGLIMEMMMSLGGDDGKIKQMYQYHKIGCPIAWISGFLNKYSIFRIKLNEDTCKTCGICDKQCYIVAMEPAKFSLYKSKMTAPGDSYTCSKCLKCVASCPNGSLTYKV
ncbi:MAG: 4Fe-4S binding protein [Bacteroidota bacterium]|nr:4Fe-4S binding protein [Bacteroidota bacterium]